MKVKVISDGVRTRIVDENGKNVEGVVAARWVHAAVDERPSLELQIQLIEVEIEGEAIFKIAHPDSGLIRNVSAIVFADGTEWIAR